MYTNRPVHIGFCVSWGTGTDEAVINREKKKQCTTLES